LPHNILHLIDSQLNWIYLSIFLSCAITIVSYWWSVIECFITDFPHTHSSPFILMLKPFMRKLFNIWYLLFWVFLPAFRNLDTWCGIFISFYFGKPLTKYNDACWWTWSIFLGPWMLIGYEFYLTLFHSFLGPHILFGYEFYLTLFHSFSKNLW